MIEYTQYFEEIPVGQTNELGAHTFTADEIKAYAAAYDPSPLYMDEEAAKAGPFGGLTASPLHVANIWMRLMLDARPGINKAHGPSPGFFDWAIERPVYAGETITYRVTFIEGLDLKSRPQWGISRSRNEAFNENAERVWSFTGQGLMLKQPKDGETNQWAK